MHAEEAHAGDPDTKQKPGGVEWIVCGLGNPGARYAETRHNAGFRVLDLLGKRCSSTFVHDHACNAELARCHLAEKLVVLVKPLTFMNRSGRIVPPLLERYPISSLSRFVAVVDDLDLAPGRIRLRRGGSSGGQKGIADIIEKMGTDAFPRVRIGIGRPQDDADSSEHVLGVPEDGERLLLGRSEQEAADAVETILAAGIEVAMNRFNRKGVSSGD